MYKKDLHRIEDAIFPLMLEGLLKSQSAESPELKNVFDKPIKILQSVYIQNLNTAKLLRRAERVEKKVRQYWEQEKTRTLKAYMALSHLYKSLEKEQQFEVYKTISAIFKEVDEIFEEECKKNNDVYMQDKSAAKQAPKVFKILQDEGLF